MDIRTFLQRKSEKTEAALEAYIAGWTKVPDRLVEAMRYSLFAGGKRLRPALALGAAELVGGEDDIALPAACAFEMIHTYSLIHDDLPAMDNDDLRRGKPTAHKVYGEATAILAGDALLTMAFDIAAGAGEISVIQEIAQAAGVAGMAGGQQWDLEAEGEALDLTGLQRIHRAKTGALIRGALRCGAILAKADAEALAALTAYGEEIGLAFQITDDILDVVGTEAKLGKPIGSDAQNVKATYPALLGLDASRALAQEAIDRACVALDPFGENAAVFRALAQFILRRQQ